MSQGARCRYRVRGAGFKVHNVDFVAHGAGSEEHGVGFPARSLGFRAPGGRRLKASTRTVRTPGQTVGKHACPVRSGGCVLGDLVGEEGLHGPPRANTRGGQKYILTRVVQFEDHQLGTNN